MNRQIRLALSMTISLIGVACLAMCTTMDPQESSPSSEKVPIESRAEMAPPESSRSSAEDFFDCSNCMVSDRSPSPQEQASRALREDMEWEPAHQAGAAEMPMAPSLRTLIDIKFPTSSWT